MGRPKDATYLSLARPDKTPLPDEEEFDLIHQRDFTVPFEDIRAVEAKGTVIPGLWTRQVGVKEKWLAQKDILPVKVLYRDDGDVTETCFVLTGRNSIEDLAAKVHSKFHLNAVAELAFFANEKILPDDSLFMDVYKEHLSSDGLVLTCIHVDAVGN